VTPTRPARHGIALTKGLLVLGQSDTGRICHLGFTVYGLRSKVSRRP